MANWMKCGRGWWLLALLLLLVGLAHAADDPGIAMERKFGIYTDFATTLRVQLIGNRLALSDGLPQASFQIINSRDLNAFALPDGRVYITSMMATLVSDDELAFVLGHELTHVKEKHAEHQSQNATGGAILGAILAAVLGGSASDIRTGADIAGGLTFGHYSRKDELRADDGGVRLMSTIGYDPVKAADAMQRLIDKYGRGDANTPVLGWFATHPDTKSRRDRLVASAQTLKEKPLPKIDDPRAITLSLDPSAQHARAWVHPFLSIMLVNTTGGRTVVLPSTEFPLPPAPKNAALPSEDPKAKNEPKETLQPVTVVLPPSQPHYALSVGLRQVPAGGAGTLETSEGTAVEATLTWTDQQTGMQGVCTAIAQRKGKGPWMAQDELKDPASLGLLEDGRNQHLEGTLEAAALRRVCRAYAEIVKSNGPVHHDGQVTIKFKAPGLRTNDYVIVLRKTKTGVEAVAEVRVDRYDGKIITGTVLWGSHTYVKDDQFVTASS